VGRDNKQKRSWTGTDQARVIETIGLDEKQDITDTQWQPQVQQLMFRR